MRNRVIILAAVMMTLGCSKSPPPQPDVQASHPGVRINDSLMYISANPVEGKPVTFWHSLTDERKQLLQEAMTWRYGPSGVTVQPEGKEPAELSKIEVSSARLTRKILVQQGDSVLYEMEEDVTQDNLESLCSFTLESSDWEDIPLTDENISYAVAYYRYCDVEFDGVEGFVRNCDRLVGETVAIPVRKQ